MKLPLRMPPVLGLVGILAACAAPLAVAPNAWCDARCSTQTRTVAAFTRVELRAPIRAEVHEGRAAQVSVTIDDALQPELVTRVNGDTLVVDLQTHGNVQISRDAHVNIDVPSLRGITVEGPGNAAITGAGDHPQLDLAVTGPGDVAWSGNAGAVKCDVDGPGTLTLQGRAGRLDANVDGPGNLEAAAFAITAGNFDVSGPGSVRADLHGGDVSVVVSGPGGFGYTGDAHFTRREVSGPGYIRKL